MKRINLTSADGKHTIPFDLELPNNHPASVHYRGTLFVLQQPIDPSSPPAIRTYVESEPFGLSDEQRGDLDEDGKLPQPAARPQSVDDTAEKLAAMNSAKPADTTKPPAPAPDTAPLKPADQVDESADWLKEQEAEAATADAERLEELNVAVKTKLTADNRPELLSAWEPIFESRLAEIKAAAQQ